MMPQHRNKALYDTSVYHELLKDSHVNFNKELNKYNKYKKFGLYYSIIELNLGLLYSWVGYFNDVLNTQSTTQAMIEAADKWGRTSKNVIILEGLNKRFNEVTPNHNIDAYLTQLEVTIFIAVTIIETSVTQFIGTFQNHDLAELMLDDRKNYKIFLELCNKHKNIEIADFLKQNMVNLNKIKLYIDELKLTRNFRLLRDIDNLVVQAITNTDRCDMPSQNRKYGDIVIALQQPLQQLLITTDNSFGLLSNSLSKPFVKIDLA